MRFIADAMLGSLSRWLRLLGFDTLYYRDISDAELLRIARAEKRCLLTRDSDFKSRENPSGIILVKSETAVEQAAEVLGGMGLKPQDSRRCANCNGALVEVMDRLSIVDAVPDHVFHSHSRFHKCPDCGNIYWEGSHYRNFMETVNRIISNAKGT